MRQCAQHAIHVIAIDDGSTDETPQQLARAASESPHIISILTHSRNRGKGVALMNGFRHALAQTDCDVIVTLDSDGQHRPGDIPRVARPCLAGQADLVIAQRQFPRTMPTRSRIGNNLCAAVLSRVYRETPRDTQCGMRAHTRCLVEEIVRDIEGNRYDTEARIVMRSLFLKRRIGQVPIPAIYHGRNESSHYRPLADSLTILRAFFTTVVLPELGIRNGTSIRERRV
jgi:glycosyltransferase involved in cell wall biosynthesis